MSLSIGLPHPETESPATLRRLPGCHGRCQVVASRTLEGRWTDANGPQARAFVGKDADTKRVPHPMGVSR